MQAGYNEDLAYIHDVGFGQLAERAAGLVIELLAKSGVYTGTIVDLGCGSGITARLLRDVGYDVIGFDISTPLIEKARERVPDAEFRVASFVSAEIPQCVAVTSIGEVFNYTFDKKNGAVARSKVFERIFAALTPGGILVFDIAGPTRVPSCVPHRTFSEGADWTVLVEMDADDSAGVLTRRITTFRKQGALFRRDHEDHSLQLIDSAHVIKQLREIGFVVKESHYYGMFALPKGLVAILAKKPSGADAQQDAPSDAKRRHA